MRAPPPDRIADELEALAVTLRRHGRTALRRADDYAARGLPAATLSDGRRGGDTTSSVERAATHPDRLDTQRTHLRLAMRLTWTATLRLHQLITSTLGHADPAAITRANTAGTGHCAACTRHVPGTATDRLRAGYCHACHRAWLRAGRPDRSAFARTRKPTQQGETP